MHTHRQKHEHPAWGCLCRLQMPVTNFNSWPRRQRLTNCNCCSTHMCVCGVCSTWGKRAFAPEGATERKQAVKQRAPWKVCYALSSPENPHTFKQTTLSMFVCMCGAEGGRGLDCVKTHLHCLSATLTVYLQIVSSRRQLCAKLKWN